LFQQKKEAGSITLPREDRNSVNEFIKDSSVYAIKNIKSVSLILDHSLNLLVDPKTSDKAEIQHERARLKAFHEKITPRILRVVRKMGETNISAGRYNISLFDHAQDLFQSSELIYDSVVHHRKNLHAMPSGKLRQELHDLRAGVSSYLRSVRNQIRHHKDSVALKSAYDQMNMQIERVLNSHVLAIQKGEVGNRLALLQTKVLLETQDLVETVYRIALLQQSAPVHLTEK